MNKYHMTIEYPDGHVEDHGIVFADDPGSAADYTAALIANNPADVPRIKVQLKARACLDWTKN